jgi:DNA-binding transcriptional regulator YiaG
MAISVIPYSIQVRYDRRNYPVFIPNFSVPKCTNCGTISIDPVASKQIDEEFRKTARLLTSAQIRKSRKAIGLSQKRMAKLLGISNATLCRWESGNQVQQRAFDNYLRAFFASIWLRWYLAAIRTGEVSEAPEIVQPIMSSARNTTAVNVASDPDAIGTGYHPGSVTVPRSQNPSLVAG